RCQGSQYDRSHRRALLCQHAGLCLLDAARSLGPEPGQELSIAARSRIAFRPGGSAVEDDDAGHPDRTEGRHYRAAGAVAGLRRCVGAVDSGADVLISWKESRPTAYRITRMRGVIVFALINGIRLS